MNLKSQVWNVWIKLKYEYTSKIRGFSHEFKEIYHLVYAGYAGLLTLGGIYNTGDNLNIINWVAFW